MFENADYIKIIAWLLGVGGVMSGIIGGLAVYIFKEHVEDNNCQFSKNYHEHEKFRDSIEKKADKK